MIAFGADIPSAARAASGESETGHVDVNPDPRKTLNRHDAKVAKDTLFRSLRRRTRKRAHGAFRGFVLFPQGLFRPLRSWRLGG